MNKDAEKSLKRLLAQLDRRQKSSGRRFTTSPFILAAGLFLNMILLNRMVPQVWPSLLGTDPGLSLRGWPLLVWQASRVYQHHVPAALVAICGLFFVTFLLNYGLRFFRPVTWLLAVVVIAVDAGIVWATIQACLQESGFEI